MTRPNCAEFKQLVSLIRLGDPAEVLPVIARLPDIEPCITAGLRQAADEQDWLTFERCVIVASDVPTRPWPRFWLTYSCITRSR